MDVNPQVLTRLSLDSATSADKLFQIVKYLDTTCEYPLTGKDEKNNVQNANEETFMYFYRHLPCDYTLPIRIMTQQMYEIAKATNRLVENEWDDIIKQLEKLNPEAGKELLSMNQDAMMKYINEERRQNENFENYLRRNFALLSDKRKKDLTILEIDKILEKFKTTP